MTLPAPIGLFETLLVLRLGLQSAEVLPPEIATPEEEELPPLKEFPPGEGPCLT